VRLLSIEEPEVFMLPLILQSPEATQLSTLLLVQLSVVEPSYATPDGLADKLTEGAEGKETLMFTVSLTLPPNPLQVSEKLLSDVRALIVWEPVVALAPDQSPEAVQLLTLVLLQLNVVEPFMITLEGLAEIETVGVDGFCTDTSTRSPITPSGPRQFKRKVLSAVRPPMVSESFDSFAPDQSPEATQAATSSPNHSRVTLPI
jgi:hypothetical protein